MWSNIWAGLGPTLPNEGTTWFKAKLDHYFYTSDWHDMVQKFFGLSWLKSVWHNGLGRVGPTSSIPRTRPH
jgi:hypothetical protein